MTPNERSREAAYADLVSGLIDARIDVASERFDSELEAAEASGRLDPATARLLRWWQRESVRSVTEHARTTVPATLVALETAEREAREAVHRAEAAWTTARGVTARAAFAAEPAASRVPEPAAVPAAPPAPAAAAPQPPVAPPAAPYPAAPPAPTAPPRVSAPAPATTPLEPPNYPGGPVPTSAPAAPSAAPPAPQPTPPAPTAPAPQAPYPTTPGEAPGIVDLTAREETADAGQAGRRRTLLAGLTVLPRND